MKIDGTYLSNFIIGSLYFYLFILFLLALYFGWNFYNTKNNRVKNKINSKVAEEMVKKITEEAVMHRKGRQEKD
tara:strand:- start:248 stop:469 length:222 start_codon:yes stop_codon:yes gene_type:complete